LYILDESTSSLDGQTEKAILEFFDDLIGTKTIIFVTHKIKNAINADLVVCMKNGQICETGTHENLIEAHGYYARLYKIQNMLEVL
jgi:ABC-type multidrug transport system fused ATPase/permease subunit